MTETIETSQDEVLRLKALIGQLTALTDRICATRQSGQLDEEALSTLVATTARLFADRVDRDPATTIAVPPDRLNATQSVMLIKALMEVTDINLFDLAIWYRRVG